MIDPGATGGGSFGDIVRSLTISPAAVKSGRSSRGQEDVLPGVLELAGHLGPVEQRRAFTREQLLAVVRKRVPVGGERAGLGLAEELRDERDGARVDRRGAGGREDLVRRLDS